MSVAALLSEAKELGVELWLEGGRIRYRAPKAALISEFLTELAVKKPELLTELAKRPCHLYDAETHYRMLCKHLHEDVMTPEGPGKLWQVFRERTGVVIGDSVWFFNTATVRPIRGEKGC